MTVPAFKERCGYTIDGVWLPRVTSIVSAARSPGEKGEAYMSRFSALSGMRQAAEWGTSVHETIEKILQGEEHKVASKIAIAIEKFRSWYEKNPFLVSDPAHDIERRVWDARRMYAGTLDFVAEVNGKIAVVDIKTSTAIVKEHYLQTAAYVNAYNAAVPLEKRCVTRWILRIDQYQECRGCLAKRREKYGRTRTSGGNPLCNHQWSPIQGEVEFQELKNYEQDLDAFFDVKERWEARNKAWLEQIPNYPKNIKQPALL